MISKAAFALALASSVSAQCKPDLLIDDYAKIDIHNYEGAQRNFNLVGGDYGQVGIDVEYSTATKDVTLTANTVPDNFWFSKFDLGACFDLTGYTAIEFNMVAPANAKCSFTLTQKSPNCVDRLVDSTYQPLSKYITPNGQVQKVSMPLSDFAQNVNGTAFDFKHLKDWTLVSLEPKGVSVKISNFVLKGNCGGTATSAPGTTTTKAGITTGTPKANSDVAKSSIFGAAVFALFQFFA